jgi:CheY-like chemotaxis protein
VPSARQSRRGKREREDLEEILTGTRATVIAALTLPCGCCKRGPICLSLALVLLIEDDPGVRTGLKRILTSLGYDVTTAGDGVEGLQSFRTSKPDVVITDLIMPNQGGLVTIAAIKGESPETPIIAISGESGGDASLRAARVLGAVATLEKPILLETLAEALGKALAKEEGRREKGEGESRN